ncbi:hypothetical protein WAI453_006335 [Rhynchosporium graminicola]
MKLTILSPLFISGAFSAAINDASLKARIDSPENCQCTLIMYNGNLVVDTMPNLGDYIPRNAKVLSPKGVKLGYCTIEYNRNGPCAGWKLDNPPHGPHCADSAPKPICAPA